MSVHVDATARRRDGWWTISVAEPLDVDGQGWTVGEALDNTRKALALVFGGLGEIDLVAEPADDASADDVEEWALATGAAESTNPARCWRRGDDQEGEAGD